MIRPQELKIGNLFHSTNRIKGIKMPFGVAKVLTLGVFDLEWLPPDQIPAQVEVWNKSRYSEIEPIPLTPEWLKKFGFKHSIHFGYGGSPMNFSGPEMKNKALYHTGTIYWQGKELNVEFTNEHGHYACIDFLNIKYVHQLQNLVFALSGEELIAVSQEQIQPPKTEAQEP